MVVSNRKRMIDCPHCGGHTKCGCETCRGNSERGRGICQVCKGIGKIPNPEYDPNFGKKKRR